MARPERLDVLPDTGCIVNPKCISCPLSRCAYEMTNQELNKYGFRRIRGDELIRLRENSVAFSFEEIATEIIDPSYIGLLNWIFGRQQRKGGIKWNLPQKREARLE